MNKLLISTLLFFLSNLVAYAQDAKLKWAVGFGETKSEIAASVIDEDGNVYTTGYFENTVDFDPGIATYNLSSKGRTDVFVQKLDKDGNFVWAVSYGGTSFDRAYYLTIDTLGNLFIGGFFYDSGDFDPGPKTHTLTSNGLFDIYVQKLDTAGNFKWAKSIGNKSDDLIHGIHADNKGNVLFSGTYKDKLDADPGAKTFTLSSTGDYDVFFEKLDSKGNFLWAKTFGGSLAEGDVRIKSDHQGNIVIAGTFRSTADLDPGPKTSSLTSNGFRDVFIEKLNSKGDLIWVKSIGGSRDDIVYDLALDAKGNIYTTGLFNNTVDFDPGPLTTSLSSNGKTDVFVHKLFSNGNFAWARTIGSTGLDNSYSLDIDNKGAVYVTGAFESSIDLDPGTSTKTFKSNGQNDVFLLKLDSQASYDWGITYGGSNADFGRRVNVKRSSSIYTTGTFMGTVDFDPSTSGLNLTSKGAYDVYIQRLDQCQDDYVIDEVNSCDTFKWIDGKTYRKSNYTAQHVLRNASGCDSVITLNLTINNAGIETVHACDSFVWIDGITYKSSNHTATHTLKSSTGCDSVVSLNLTITPTDYSTDTVWACQSYTWMDGKTYTQSTTTPTFTLTNSKGCDSVVQLQLYIGTPDATTQKVSTCYSYKWIDGNTYFVDTYGKTVTLTNRYGCDSVVTLDLKINNAIWVNDTVTACEQYTWINGVTYTSSNYSARDTLVSSAGCDSIVWLKLTIGSPDTVVDQITACKSYTWIDGVTYVASNNTASYKLTNQYGCDSVVNLDLTVDTVDVDIEVDPSNTTVKALAKNARFKWLDCRDDYAPISGANTREYKAQEDGEYAVEVSQNGCTDTSNCVFLSKLGIAKQGLSSVRIYPNPNQGTFQIDLNGLTDVSVHVLNLHGQMVYQRKNLSSGLHTIGLDLISGNYIVQVVSENRVQYLKMSIEE